VTISLNNFSFDIYRQIKSDKENLFFSPLSIDLALLMAYEGAMSETKSEFEKVLYLDKNIKYNGASDFISDIKKWNVSVRIKRYYEWNGNKQVKKNQILILK
jgi:serpin B